jgi:hypothetical protein
MESNRVALVKVNCDRIRGADSSSDDQSTFGKEISGNPRSADKTAAGTRTSLPLRIVIAGHEQVHTVFIKTM